MAMDPSPSAWVKYRQRGSIAVIELQRPSALNALNLEMIQALRRNLEIAESDPAIKAVLLLGHGSKGFCAGGDVKAVIERVRSGDLKGALEFFAREYELDLALHRFRKPLAALGHGLVMGGGLGLFQGARYRLLTANSVLSMPETWIGFFPDVGASAFLGKLPRNVRLVLTTTSARLAAVDALSLGLADAILAEPTEDQLVGILEESPESAAFERLKAREQTLASPIWPSFRDELASLLSFPTTFSGLELWDQKARSWLRDSRPWVRSLGEGYMKGSPRSIAVAFRIFSQDPPPSLEESFNQDLILAENMLRNPDFTEGVRARLIDKDHRPRWQESQVCEQAWHQAGELLKKRES